MSGLFGVLDIASRGLMLSQRGIRVAGHNIANAETPGYTRQRQVLAALPPQLSTAGHVGLGAEQVTIERLSDAFVHAQLVREDSSLGSRDAQANALAALEGVLNEQADGSLTDALNAFYDAFDDLGSATAPGAAVEREALRSTARSLLDNLHAHDTQLRELVTQADEGIRGLLPQINQLTAEIQQLNSQITAQETLAPANDLRDQRDASVRKLAGLIDIDSFEQPGGALTVTLSGGLPLVEGNRARVLEASPDPTHPILPGAVGILYRDGNLSLDVTGDIGSGKMGGLLRVRDLMVPAAIRSLDTIAYNLATTVNAVHAAGQGLDGLSGDFFAAPVAVEDTARNLVLDARITTSTDGIAAGLSAAPSDNRNALALAALRNAGAPLSLPGDPPGPPSGPSRSVLAHLASVVSDIGEQARAMDQAFRQQRRVVEGLEDRRDEISGVSMDEEVTNLIQLQAAFQANSRIVGIVDRLLQDVLDLL